MIHQLTVVIDGPHVNAVYVDVSDSNIDGTLRLYDEGMLAAEWGPGEWTSIKLLEVDCTEEADDARVVSDGESQGPDAP